MCTRPASSPLDPSSNLRPIWQVSIFTSQRTQLFLHAREYSRWIYWPWRSSDKAVPVSPLGGRRRDVVGHLWCRGKERLKVLKALTLSVSSLFIILKVCQPSKENYLKGCRPWEDVRVIQQWELESLPYLKKILSQKDLAEKRKWYDEFRMRTNVCHLLKS